MTHKARMLILENLFVSFKVTIQHADEDSSDISIDVEDLDDLDKAKPPKHIVQPNIENEKPSSQQTIPASNDPSSPVKQEAVKESSVIELIEDSAKELNSLEEPQSETILDHSVVTELEKYVNPDFFEGRPSKTPERYLRVSFWKN